VSQVAYDNLKWLSAYDKPFDGVSSALVRKFFSKVAPGLTAKIFRTFSATHEFSEQLKQLKGQPSDVLLEANVAVAQLLNHKRAVPKTWEKSWQAKIDQLKKLDHTSDDRARVRVQKLKRKMDKMLATKELNLTTSIKQYVDPRVPMRYCTVNDYDWRKYYPKSLQGRFTWAENEVKVEFDK
jgi:DNA topoisomerase-1